MFNPARPVAELLGGFFAVRGFGFPQVRRSPTAGRPKSCSPQVG
jgi:hypothetical protein